jgi:SAM-dependent methyltransferase
VSERQPGLLFGEVAQDYDRVRPSYPPALIDQVMAYSPALDEGWRALEIGAGTGKATAAFAAYGRPVVAVEPDPAMAAVLAGHHWANVQIVTATFEDSQTGPGFALLYSADAWHWTRPESRWPLAARSLAPGGALALFGNNGRIADPALRQAVLDLLAPTIAVHDEPVPDRQLLTVWPGDELALRPEFEARQAYAYRYPTTMSGADYRTHMMTRSQVRMMSPSGRQALWTGLGETLPAEVPLAVETLLYLARRR